MLYSVIKRYSLQLIFTISLLLGLQLPNFLQQYELRLQGHFSEAQQQLKQFQTLADVYFSGDLQALITKHKNSDVEVFRDESLVIQNSYTRVQFLQQKIDHLKQPIWYRLGYLGLETQEPIVLETWEHYEANILLNQQAILVGIVVAILMMLMLETLLYLCRIIIIKLIHCFKKNENNQVL